MNYQDALIAGLRGEISALEDQLAAAREENERLRRDFYKLCHEVEKLCNPADAAEHEFDDPMWREEYDPWDDLRTLAALRSRDDDEGRVERVQSVLLAYAAREGGVCRYVRWVRDDMKWLSERVLAAADST